VKPCRSRSLGTKYARVGSHDRRLNISKWFPKRIDGDEPSRVNSSEGGRLIFHSEDHVSVESEASNFVHGRTDLTQDANDGVQYNNADPRTVPLSSLNCR
jgi:hypothetical protein